MGFRNEVKDFDWVSMEYPILWYVVEVKYSGDIAIAYVNTKRGEAPVEKDNRYGFTLNYVTYEEAKKAAQRIATELNLAF